MKVDVIIFILPVKKLESPDNFVKRHQVNSGTDSGELFCHVVDLKTTTKHMNAFWILSALLLRQKPI